MNTNLSGIILEGIPGTGKTTSLAHLLQAEAWQRKSCLSSIILTEHQTLRLLEEQREAGTLTKADNLALLDSHVSYLEQCRQRLDKTTWLERERSNQKLPFVFERFHLSHVYHYGYLSWDDVADIDARLAQLQATIFLFLIDPEDIQERIIEDYKKSGWGDYLQKLGNNNREIIDHFARKQEEIVKLAKLSQLPVEYVNSSKKNTSDILEQILDRWQFIS